MKPESYPKRASRVPIAGWEVELARQSIAPSTTSAPALTHASIVAAPVPAVS